MTTSKTTKTSSSLLLLFLLLLLTTTRTIRYANSFPLLKVPLVPSKHHHYNYRYPVSSSPTINHNSSSSSSSSSNRNQNGGTTLFRASSSVGIASLLFPPTNYHRFLVLPKRILKWVVVAIVCKMIVNRFLSSLTNHGGKLGKTRFGNIIRNILWPNYYVTDPNYPNEPLLSKSVAGCPILGCNILSGSKRHGPEYFYQKTSSKLKNPNLWSFYSFGSPVASIVGTKLVTKLQNMEFTKLQIMGGSNGSSTSSSTSSSSTSVVKKKNVNTESLFGGTNLMFEQDRQKHKYLRTLVGSTMTSQSLSTLVPTIQDIATKYIQNQMLNGSNEDVVKMEIICYDYTTEIVSKQILGFDDNDDEPDQQIQIEEELKVLIQTWLKGMYSWLSFFPFIKKLRPAYKARQQLTRKLEKQVDKIINMKQQNQLQHQQQKVVMEEEETKPKATLLENMINAVHNDDDADVVVVDDDDDEILAGRQRQQSLTRDEVIQNTLLLVVAGTDNTTSTLVLLILLLGLHPNVLDKLAKEQDEFILKKKKEEASEEVSSSLLTYNQLMDGTTFPYLDAVIKEVLRMGPITGGFPRKTTETIVVDGYQIPKGWYVFGNYRLSHILDPVLFKQQQQEGDGSVPNYDHMDPIKGFQPERWLSNETMPSEFLAFGAGPRYCLGVNLALLELKVFVAILARTLTFELVGKSSTGQVEWNPATMVPRPLDGVLVRPKKR